MCQLLKIPRSSYYAGIKPKAINAKEIEINTLVRQVFNQSNGSAGARTISYIISKQKGIKLTRYKVGKIMKKLGLVSRQYLHKYKHKDKEHTIYQNTINRNFTTKTPSQVWYGLASQVIKSAYVKRNNPKGVVFHSDQGTHYTSKEFAEILEDCQIKASMSRRGNCWDNAPMERFFRSFKTEWMPKNGYDSQEQVTRAISDYIFGYYIRETVKQTV